MTGKFLLGTNIVIALFANDSSVIDKLQVAEDIFIPSIVLGELYYGARKSERTNENLARIDEFTLDNTILSCDSVTAQRYGEVKEGLRQIGRPIPENDVWIASLALQHELTLVSRDTHYSEVQNLTLETW
jgi:tRNA(fMet)-specific endonuclease VapC